MASKSTIDATDGRLAHERQRLRSLAHWYREFAERTGNLAIWEARLRTAKELEQEADRLGEESVLDRLGHRTRGGEGEQGTNPQFAVRSGK